MSDLDARERDGWTRARAPMTKQEKLELLREMKDRLKAGQQQEKER
jgi:hypothetical protein